MGARRVLPRHGVTRMRKAPPGAGPGCNGKIVRFVPANASRVNPTLGTPEEDFRFQPLDTYYRTVPLPSSEHGGGGAQLVEDRLVREIDRIREARGFREITIDAATLPLARRTRVRIGGGWDNING